MLTIKRLDIAEFEAMEKEWNHLLLNSSSPAVFLTWEWSWTWWQVFGHRYRLMLLKIHDSNTGQCVGLAPLKIARRSYYGVFFRQVEFIGFGPEVGPDYLNFIVAPGYQEEMGREVWNYLLERGEQWDTVFLTDVADPVTLSCFNERARSAGYTVLAEEKSVCPYLPIEGTWEDYFKSLSKSHRTDLNRCARNLSKNHRISFDVIKRSPEIGRAMEELFELHQRRWNKRGESGSFDRNSLNKMFHQRLAAKMNDMGWLVIYVLKVDGVSVAAFYTYHYEGRVYYYQSGVDMNWAKYGVGQLLIQFILQDLFKQRMKEFDFLRGAHPYKYKWAIFDRKTGQSRVWNRHVYGYLLKVLMRFGRRVREARSRFFQEERL